MQCVLHITAYLSIAQQPHVVSGYCSGQYSSRQCLEDLSYSTHLFKWQTGERLSMTIKYDQQLSDITKELLQTSLPVRLQHSGKLFIPCSPDLTLLLWNIQSRVQHHI